MICAFCANPCIDRTVTIPKFTYGGMNRIQDVRQDGSGKGVNVAIACRQLGMEAACIGLMGRENGGLVRARMEQDGVVCDLMEFDGAVRINTKVLDRATGIVTEINEKGQPVTAEQVAAMVAQCVDWAGRSSFLVLTGSLPPGCPDDLYAQITRAVHAAAPDCRVLLDAEGEKLRQGLAARPYMIKPNRYELELLAGHELPGIQDVHAFAQELVAQGIQVVTVSLGGDGAYVTDGAAAFYAPIMDVPVRSTVGAGDSMVAGMLRGFDLGLSPVEAFRHGVAAASSSVTTEGTMLVDRAVYEDLLPQVRLVDMAG